MKPEIKKKWLAALRSGQYRQTTVGRLTDGQRFCCLGVLCNLHALETGTAWERNEEGLVVYDGEAYYLPGVVQKWAGIRGCRPMVKGQELADLNDSPQRFKTIAKLIEESL